jgi:hypothetical protein
MIRSCLLLSLTLPLFACGNKDAADDTGGSTVIDDTGSDNTGDDGLLTGADLVGVWSSTGCEAYDDGNGGQNYLTRSFSLTDSRWSLDLTIYGDPDCTYGLFSSAIEGPYTLGGAASVEGATNGDFGFTTNVWTPLVEDLATVFEQSGCASGAWEVGVGQDVTETGCIGVAHPIAECPVEFDIVKVEGDDLYFGARVTDMCQESGRPTALADYAVSR